MLEFWPKIRTDFGLGQSTNFYHFGLKETCNLGVWVLNPMSMPVMTTKAITTAKSDKRALTLLGKKLAFLKFLRNMVIKKVPKKRFILVRNTSGS